VYRAYAQRGPARNWATSVSIRSAGPPVASLMRPLVAALGAVQPNLSFTLRPLAGQVDATLVQERLLAKLSGFFGGLALLLAALGLYGITAYSVTRRRGEIGIRLAMGGTPADVVRLVLGRVVWLVGIGLVAGCLGAYWAARFVTALLYGVESRDPVTFAAAVAVLVVTALVAGAVPAWRASRVDPTTVLRAL
jgi:ABC-type antimicrobial peptide transport system permease subunit